MSFSQSLDANNPTGLVAGRRALEQALLDQRRALELEKQFPGRVFAGGTQADLADDQQALDDSPDFGTDARKQVANVQQTNADMAAYNRPDVTQKRTDDFAKELAMKVAPNVETAKVQGANALALSKQNADLDSAQRDKTLKAYLGMGDDTSGAPRGSQRTVHIGANGDPTISIAPPKPMGQLEQRAITSFHEAQPILDDLDRELGTPNTDVLSQLLSKGKNMVTQGAYSAGLSTDNQTKQQLEGLLAVLGSSSYVVGSRSYQLIKQAMAHLTTANGSDAFNKQQLKEIRALWPRMQEEVMAAHQTPERALNQGAPDSTTPNDPLRIR